MRDIEKVNRQLLKTEFDVAKAIYEQARGDGYGPVVAAAIVYRCGYLDGRDTQRERTKKAYSKLNELRKAEAIAEVAEVEALELPSLPEADEKGENENE